MRPSVHGWLLLTRVVLSVALSHAAAKPRFITHVCSFILRFISIKMCEHNQFKCLVVFTIEKGGQIPRSLY